ncbi:MAG: Flp pilus assembly protein CpaB [Chloroflexi bacterium]|nr:MAG: Flp pilus assembly protein CpaB [Chloroflexota bacterium]
MARMQGLTIPRGNRSLLIIAALAGLAAAVLFVVAVNNGDSKSAGQSPGATGNTVVAVKDIPAGNKIEADMVAIKKAPDDLLVANPLDDTAKVAGQYAAYDITAGEQITLARIGAATPSGCKIECVIPKGMVGIGLAVKEVTAVGGLLYPSDRVNIVGAFEIKNDGSLKDCASPNLVKTQTILQNLEVLAVAQQQQNPAAANSGASDPNSGSTGTRPADAKQQPGAATITLAVSPEDSQKLISAQERANTVWTSLRPVGDNEIRDIPILVECGHD